MGDDLSAFFAKRTDKKKKAAVKMEDVAQTLERRAKRQEESDCKAEIEKRNEDDAPKRSAGGEESEWIEYGDSNTGRLEGLKIKDMGAETEVIEEEQVQSEDLKEQQDSGRTWGHVEKKDVDVESAVDMANYQRQANSRPVFVPSALRDQHRRNDIDVSNQEMFPSLADASKIEQDKKEDKVGGWTKSGSSSAGPARTWGGASSGPPPSVAREKENALAAAKALASAEPARMVPRPAPAPEPELKKAGGSAYVPPHLRGKN